MRITANLVIRAAQWTQGVTSGEFAFGWHGADLGNGVRYVDGIRQLVWLGRTGAREALAYYLSAGTWWQVQKNGDIPVWVSEALAFVASAAQPPRVRKAAAEGLADAELRWARG